MAECLTSVAQWPEGWYVEVGRSSRARTVSCAHLDAYISELRELCAIECPTASKEGVDEAARWVERWVARRRDWTVRVSSDETVGDSLLVSVRGGNPRGLGVLLAAHLDTVYPLGIAAQRPLRIEDDHILGPGTCDNKSGLLSGLYAMAALQDLDMLGSFNSIGLLCGGDEETDMRSSFAFIRNILPEYDLALVLEAAARTATSSARARPARISYSKSRARRHTQAWNPGRVQTPSWRSPSRSARSRC